MSRRSKKHRVSGEESWKKAFDEVDHAPLLEWLGVDLDEELLRLALTHRSFANEHDYLPNNERLEFLGDAVLGLTVATKLFEIYPSSSESVLSPMRASIVSRYGLADVARGIDLGKYVLLGKGELHTGGREKESILADTTEALFGAIYRQYGFETARDVILKLFHEKLHNATAHGHRQDWKTVLQERLAERGIPMVEYVTTSEGPEHNLEFTSYAMILGENRGRGVARNKKLAEQEAAREAVAFFQEHPEAFVLEQQHHDKA